jgi:hypothetical protein
MAMPDPLARRQTTLPVVQQYPAHVPVPQTQAQLAQVVSLGTTVLDAKDHAFQEIESRVNKGGRSYTHQRYIEGQAADTIISLTVAMDEIYKRKMLEIVNNQPKERVREVVTETRYEKAPAKGLNGYLFG